MDSYTTTPANVKAPTLVIILSWLLLLGGILGLLVSSALTLLSAGAFSLLTGLAIVGIVKNIGAIILSFGLRKMKKWALYTYIFLVILTIVTTNNWSGSIVEIVIYLVILGYLWSLRKRFV